MVAHGETAALGNRVADHKAVAVADSPVEVLEAGVELIAGLCRLANLGI